jgi:2-polyprenyl-3-methyl-5-hydroxy-6-metoxy-1,4-benzoquinol methylase
VNQSRDHYSYAVYADPEMARTFDDRRFGGPIGGLLADTQARVLAEMLEPMAGRRILDVGTGTGRAALLLARAGADVTAVDASEEMLAVARRRAADERVDVNFLHGDAHALQFGDRAFDAVVSLRLLMHVPDWRMSMGELCRVAADLLVFDYPSAASFAIAQAATRRLLRTVGVDTEAYRVFTSAAIAGELDRRGFRIRSVHRQFVLPIQVHKAIGSRAFTQGVERACERVGLLRLLGSPVTVCAERCASS